MTKFRLSSPFASAPLALVAAAFLSSCDGDKSANPKSDAGSGGATGSGGSTVGTGGSAPAGGGSAGSGDVGGGAGMTGAGGSAGGAGGAATPVDTDIVVARFNADGSIDTSFGTAGVVRIDLGAGAGNVRDALWTVATDATDRLVLFGSRKSDVPGRVDSDRVVVRLSADGAIDTTFATMGIHTLNIANLGDNARAGFVQADGKIVAAGYTNQPTGVGTQSANRPVVLRLNDNGTPDTTFGAGGVVNYNPFMSGSPTVQWGMAEAYGIGLLSTGHYVTTGYGRSDPATMGVNLIGLKLSASGVPDATFGTAGALEKDIAGDNDRGRNLVVLPGDKIMMVGSATPSAMNVDAMIMMVTATGALDTTFNTTGYKLYKFDDRPDETFFGAALSPNNMFAAAAGYRTGGTGNNDDATLVILPLGATGTEFAAAVPLSTTTNDRFWSVTFDAANKPVAAGYVSESGDHWLAVARFNADGSRDAAFGAGGLAKVNASVGTTLEEARGVVVQSTGKIVIAGVAEHP